jgi:hypothetical protein
MTTAAIGEEGFRWFIGKVEDRDDPKQLGRVRVRVYNVHPFTSSGEPDTAKVPKDHLPWAMPINSILSAGIIKNFGGDFKKDGVGLSTTGLLVGSTVFGFFADGNECQIPLIFGTIAGLVGDEEENELPKTSYEQNSVGNFKNNLKTNISIPFPGEPDSPYNAKYPYNKTLRTESGHLVELDDTPGEERIHVMHKNGSYVEIDKEGTTVIKSMKDRFDITVEDNNVYIGGNANVKIDGNVTMYVDGNVLTKVNGTYILESLGNMIFKAPRVDINPA